MNSTKQIYLVDDDPDDIMLIREALHEVMGEVDIAEVSNGEELLNLLSQSKDHKKPALILMDMNMPRVGGLEALSILKSDPQTRRIPVVMISTTTDRSQIMQAYQKGINAFIVKPVLAEEYHRMAQAINVCFLNHYQSVGDLAIHRNFKGKSVLMIEDNDDHWELMRLALKKNMPEVNLIRMGDRDSTLDFLTDKWNQLKPAPELIIMDLYLPTRREGLNLLDSIRYFFRLHKLPPVPVVVFSYSDGIEDREACYEHQANAYMVKSLADTSLAYIKSLCYFWWETITPPKKN